MLEYIDSNQLGKIVKTRADWAVNSGLLAQVDGDYCLTSKAMREYDNFFRWITGNSSKLFKSNRYGDENKEPVLQAKTRRSLQMDEIENLFSGI